VVSSESVKEMREARLELVEAFVNTIELDEPGSENLVDPAALATWLREVAGVDPGAGLDSDDLERALALRESLRALLLTHNGVEVPARELAPLRRAAEDAHVAVQFGAEGEVALAPAGEGLAALEAKLLLAIAEAQALGTWDRLKACLADDCHWAFYDSSRNRSRTWCSMEVCGNRSKTRRYRRRRAQR
jgi:predicted RNA-binding Zn ribbon-like protein